ncbi:hypothetical protein HPB52_021155 [Rhipicephalus sanguineus]|uniref:Cytochrome c oxidase subunit 5A, mitochondrial n=1 Tax=Rhipicephalus sanguineus TaxID=34632 RepID=A0A9D4Q2J1_RHISA|nr:hypothetical protein HPB52_021155 [Rhipicephalus sanguineus]
MFAVLARSGVSALRAATIPKNAVLPTAISSARQMSKHNQETEEEFDARYEAYFNRKDIDGWEIRKAMNDLQGFDVVPEPKIVIAALKACRRTNDFALAVRFLEAIKVWTACWKDVPAMA